MPGTERSSVVTTLKLTTKKTGYVRRALCDVEHRYLEGLLGGLTAGLAEAGHHESVEVEVDLPQTIEDPDHAQVAFEEPFDRLGAYGGLGSDYLCSRACVALCRSPDGICHRGCRVRIDDKNPHRRLGAHRNASPGGLVIEADKGADMGRCATKNWVLCIRRPPGGDVEAYAGRSTPPHRSLLGPKVLEIR